MEIKLYKYSVNLEALTLAYTIERKDFCILSNLAEYNAEETLKHG